MTRDSFSTFSHTNSSKEVERSVNREESVHIIIANKKYIHLRLSAGKTILIVCKSTNPRNMIFRW